MKKIKKLSLLGGSVLLSSAMISTLIATNYNNAVNKQNISKVESSLDFSSLQTLKAKSTDWNALNNDTKAFLTSKGINELSTSIPDDAFEDLKASDFPIGFELPNSITSIGDSAFADSELPKGFQLPNSIMFIDDSAFHDAILHEDFTLEHTKIINLNFKTFDGTIIPENFKLPSTLIQIKSKVFKGAKLSKTFQIPKSVWVVDSDAFESSALPTNYKWASLWNNASIVGGSKVVPNDFADMTWGDLTKNTQKLLILKGINEFSTKVPNDAFEDFTKKDYPINFALPNTILTIGDSAFKDGEIPDDFTLPSSVTLIEDDAFENVELNSNFRIDNLSNLTVQNGAFEDAILYPFFKLPSSVTLIEKKAFAESILTDDFIWSKVEDNGVPLPSSYLGPIYVYEHEFENKKLPDEFKFFDTIREIKDYGFSNSILNDSFNLKTSNVKKIGKGAFKNSIINSNFELPDTLDFIGDRAFEGVDLPLGFTIPNGVKNINPSAFNSINFNSEFPTMWDKTDDNGNPVAGSKIVLKNGVIINSLRDFNNHTSFDEINKTLTIKGDVTEINFVPDDIERKITQIAFSNPKSLTKIGFASFYDSKITSLDLSGLTNLISIGKWAFYNSPLISLDLSGLTNLNWIGNAAFRVSNKTTYNLSGLSNLKIIGNKGFYWINETRNN